MNKHLRRALVLRDPVDIRMDIQFFEEALEIHERSTETYERHLSGQRHENRIARGSEKQSATAHSIRVCVDLLARLAYVFYRLADFFYGSASKRHVARCLDNHALDTIVDRRLLEVCEDSLQCFGLASKDLRHDVLGRVVR